MSNGLSLKEDQRYFGIWQTEPFMTTECRNKAESAIRKICDTNQCGLLRPCEPNIGNTLEQRVSIIGQRAGHPLCRICFTAVDTATGEVID